MEVEKKQLRQRKQNLNRALDLTPPSSPSIIQTPPNASDDENMDLVREEVALPVPERESTRASKGKKKIRRDRSQLYRVNLKLQEKVEKLKKQCEKYKKRCQRQEHKKNKPEIDEKTKYQKLSSTMKANYQRLRSLKEKRFLKNIILQIEGQEKEEITKESLGITSTLRTSMKLKTSATKLKDAIAAFFHRDDISRATAGKKETCTKNGEKMQKRFMLDSMKNLYKTFKQKIPGSNVHTSILQKTNHSIF